MLSESQSFITRSKKILKYSIALSALILVQNINAADAAPFACSPTAATCSNSTTLTPANAADQSIWMFNNNFNGIAGINTSTGVVTGAMTGVLVGGRNTISFTNE